MAVSENEFISVTARAAELGCQMPTGLAIMPENFETAATRQDLIVRGEASTVRTLFRNQGLPLGDFLPTGERAGFIHNKSHDWAAFIFISGALASSNPGAVSVALGIISNYLTEAFRGTPAKKIDQRHARWTTRPALRYPLPNPSEQIAHALPCYRSAHRRQ